MKKLLFIAVLMALVPVVHADPWSFSLTTWGSDANPFGAGYYTSSYNNGGDSVRVQRDYSQFMGYVQADGYSAGVTLNNPPTRSYTQTRNGGYDVTVNRGTSYQLQQANIGGRNSGFSIAQTPTGSYGGTGYINGYARPRTYSYAPYYGYPGYQFTSSPGWGGYGYSQPRSYGNSRTVVYN